MLRASQKHVWFAVMALTTTVTTAVPLTAEEAAATPVPAGASALNVQYKGPLPPKTCQVESWLPQVRSECINCNQSVTLSHCLFPKEDAPREAERTISCTLSPSSVHVYDLTLNCSSFHDDCKAPQCMVSFRSGTGDRPLGSVRDSVPGIIGGIMAVIVLIFLIFIFWRLRKLHRHRAAAEAAATGAQPVLSSDDI